MRRAGEVVRTAQGLAIVRAPADDDPVAEGTELVDESLRTVGEVVSVFGPVERPYLAVDPVVTPAGLVGEPAYARD